jgi:endogenous inhibitor of DNA gyrase (YacG/DUF329 family)
MIFQKCLYCYALVPSFPFNMGALCPKCRDQWHLVVARWKIARNIPIDVFDLWDENRMRLCRGCGKPTFRKDGKRAKLKFCSKECRNRVVDVWRQYQWKYAIAEKIRLSPKMPTNDRLVQCETCLKFIHYRKVEIHHVEPVNILTEKNFELVWDITNLKILCVACHKHSPDHQKIWDARRKAAPLNAIIKYQNYQKLDTFFKM